MGAREHEEQQNGHARESRAQRIFPRPPCFRNGGKRGQGKTLRARQLKGNQRYLALAGCLGDRRFNCHRIVSRSIRRIVRTVIGFVLVEEACTFHCVEWEFFITIN